MKLQVISKTENKLFERTEVQFELDHSGEASPDGKRLREFVASKVGSKPELTVLRDVRPVFGEAKSTGVAHIYTSDIKMKAREPTHMVKRLEKKPKEAEKPAEATDSQDKKEEEPEVKEEKKEDLKEEESK